LDNPNEKYRATLTDISGRLIFDQSINTTNRSIHQTIYLQKFAAGFYFLAVTNRDGEKVMTEKIIKQ
jgi:hypothetical protein